MDHCHLLPHTEDRGGRPYPGNCATKESFPSNPAEHPYSVDYCLLFLRTEDLGPSGEHWWSYALRIWMYLPALETASQLHLHTQDLGGRFRPAHCGKARSWADVLILREVAH